MRDSRHLETSSPAQVGRARGHDGLSTLMPLYRRQQKVVRNAPAEDVGSGPRSAAHDAPEWLMYQPFRDTVVEASEPLPAPVAQGVNPGTPPRSKADLIDRTGLDLIEVG